MFIIELIYRKITNSQEYNCGRKIASDHNSLLICCQYEILKHHVGKVIRTYQNIKRQYFHFIIYKQT